MKKIVFGILAHVDSGKTTLSEAILYKAGEIRKLGRVDKKDAFLDTNEIEKERGITIFSKQATFSAYDVNFTLVDTPGHVDFSAEAERIMSVLDYAVLVINGADGVQNHTETVWKLLKEYNVPTFVFINKMDISGFSKEEIMSDIEKSLGEGFVDFEVEGSDVFFEEIAMCDESIMEKVLNGEKIDDFLISCAIAKRKIFPCFFGSALKTDGVDAFLKSFCRYTRETEYKAEFGARVFKISEDEKGNRLTHMKITGGVLKARDTVTFNKPGKEPWEEKVNQIRIYSGAKFISCDEVSAGDVCAVTGLEKSALGDGLGFEKDLNETVLEPVLNYKIEILDNIPIHTALVKLKKLEAEDPQLNIRWDERLREINIMLMGEVQLEVIKRIIFERFDMRVEFGEGSIAYRETIKNTVEGLGHYEPLKHYAEVRLMLSPGKKGSGVVFDTKCSEDELDKNWQRLILTHLAEKQHIGVLTGSPITDIKISLTSGKAHKKHTEGGDFRQATYRAVRQGLMSAESVLLEPWYEFRLEVPQENVGRAMTDIGNMGGNFSSPEIKNDMSVIEGACPVSTMRGYHRDVTEYTSGRGRLYCRLKGYEECENAEEVIKNIGYVAESDTFNTSDSVFCSHGAGYTVKWDEVENHMHTESVLKKEAEAEQIIKQEYVKTAASDEELARIFEKTYGKVKRAEYEVVKRVKTSEEISPKKKIKKTFTGEEYLLVDGYNIIFAWEKLKKQAEQSLDLARNTLVNLLCNYKGVKKCHVILVFDAYKVKGNLGEVEKYHNISIVYTKEAETADMYIEKVTHELGKNHKVRVATSDGLEQLIILGNGAVRVPASAFQKEIEETEREIQEFLKNNK